MEGILILAALFGIIWLYYTVKQKAKRNIFFRDQYEQQKALTLHNMVITTTAPINDVQWSLSRHIPHDQSARASFVGNAMHVRMDGPNRIVYKHIGKITTGGNGDEFTASITFEPLETDRLRAVVSIDRWREKDGVTRRAGIDAMAKFMNDTVAAFQACDPAAQVSR